MFCEQLGVPLYNKAWSWCAISSEKRLALFTVWEDGIDDGRYIFTTKPRPDEIRKRPGRTELISVLNDVIQNGFAAYGIQCRAADIHAVPRQRKSFTSDSLLDMRLRRDGTNYIGQIVGRIPPEVIASRARQAAWVASAAINDIDQDEIGNPDPEYIRRMSGSYVRDSHIRSLVLKRANGICEYCGDIGFKKRDGSRYLETHHIISLSEQGPDTLDNVIALCPTDHRRSHFGADWEELQSLLKKQLSTIRNQ